MSQSLAGRPHTRDLGLGVRAMQRVLPGQNFKLTEYLNHWKLPDECVWVQTSACGLPD